MADDSIEWATVAPLAIVAAMPEELGALLSALPGAQRTVIAAREFWVGHWHGVPVVAVLCGIGKVAAALTTTLLADRFGARAVVFTGVAGGLGEGVAVGDVVVASELVQHDLDVSPLFPRYEIPGRGRSHLPADAEVSGALWQACEQVSPALSAIWAKALTPPEGAPRAAPSLHRGLVLSGDRFVSTAPESQALRQAFPQALAVEMEGAAVAQVCHDLGLPFAVVRVISDRADDSAHLDFAHFVAEVAQRYTLAIVQAAWPLLAAGGACEDSSCTRHDIGG